MNEKEKVPDELFAVVDTTIVAIIIDNGDIGDRHRGRRRRRRRIIQCIYIGEEY